VQQSERCVKSIQKTYKTSHLKTVTKNSYAKCVSNFFGKDINSV